MSPPLIDADVVGRSGNEWTAPVGADGVTVRVRFAQRRYTKVKSAHFQITPKDAPSDDVIRRLAIRQPLEPGVQTVSVHWDGRDDAGNRVAPGKYRLFSYVVIGGWTRVAYADGRGLGYQRRHSDAIESGGLGLFEMPSPRA
ncbi:MAG TPA: hypothetical protein VNB24_09725 [Acidimicrobiales bacterium]|nr:hypothetical protein [Acidimicrobiales bacterium]